MQIWHKNFRELNWEQNLKQWEFFSSYEYRISCSFSWLCSFTDCAVMFWIFPCSFETHRRMDRLCHSRSLKVFEKVYSICDYLPFASHFPLERIFSNLIFLFPCIPHWHTFPQNWKCPKVVSPKYLLSMLSQCWWWISHGSSLLCRFAGDRGQEGKQGEERCPLVLFFIWTLLFSVFSAQGNILGGGD